ncbi:ferritin-like domain-containing protein [Actinomadura macra]|uniref:ferritin-like domain-containing protein n=1 Tax=Actinomadura macra TaxID=46164 RepID=UPI000832EC69|nr:ferritin-like protein [Actinomadura macra]
MATLIEEISAHLKVPEAERNIDWLRKSLQSAVAVELATIPPYLYGMWSIKDSSSEVYGHIRTIVLQEMLHMGLACNLLSALGGHPEVSAAAQPYPTGLPGQIRQQLSVHLQGLAPTPKDPADVVKQVFMEIEMPEHPVAFAPSDFAKGAESFPTIGVFYEAIKRRLNELRPPPAFGGIQMEEPLTELFKISTVADANKAIDLIIDQGEGRPEQSGRTDLDTFPADQNPAHVAHYYRFKEIWTGRHLRYDSTAKKWTFDGPEMKRPAVHSLERMPPTGVPATDPELRKRLDECNTTYHRILSGLESAWKTGNPGDLQQAVEEMRNLEAGAADVIEYQVSREFPKVYGPEFKPPIGTSH